MVLMGMSLITAVLIGAGLGLAIAMTGNIASTIEYSDEYKPAIPSFILAKPMSEQDITIYKNHVKRKQAAGETIEDISYTESGHPVITKFFSDEYRDLVSIADIPKHMVQAMITREDEEFFHHRGFSLKGTVRAALTVLLTRHTQGGSTITQQLARNIGYADASDISIRRKLVELWWALQLERRFTKYEILEKYLNVVPFGHGNNGVEAASTFFFGHSVKENSIAESAMLAIQLVRLGLYSPAKDPNLARERQKGLLDAMAAKGFVSREQARKSFERYWKNFSYVAGESSAYLSRKDEAPYFSEHIRNELLNMLTGKTDINRDGYNVYTTLNLAYQKVARHEMNKGFERINKNFHSNTRSVLMQLSGNFDPVLEMLSLAYNIPQLKVGRKTSLRLAKAYGNEFVVPAMELLSLLYDIPEAKYAANIANEKINRNSKMTQVEGALVTLDNETGGILALIGGSKFDYHNQFNRALQAEVPPGSCFKPIYYSAAIDTGMFTPATRIQDAPYAFKNLDGTLYTPLNYKGAWEGDVSVRTALARSMNVPSLKVLEAIGFDAAIARASALLDITDPQEIVRVFPRRYPLGLGIIRISPVKMARAFSIFANGGKYVEPHAIKYVEDRNGTIILNREQQIKEKLALMGEDIQVISPQTAFVMTDLLKSTVEFGTLSSYKWYINNFTLPMGGKTGTTQNWADAWTMGFSPYMTTAIWFGFDSRGNSLGSNQSGAVAAGPVWIKYMDKITEGLPYKTFPRPETGIIELEVCEESGRLPTDLCYEDETVTTEIFKTGTEPIRECDIHPFQESWITQTSAKLNRLDFRPPFDSSDFSIDVDDIEYSDDEDEDEQDDESILEGVSSGLDNNNNDNDNNNDDESAGQTNSNGETEPVDEESLLN